MDPVGSGKSAKVTERGVSAEVRQGQQAQFDRTRKRVRDRQVARIRSSFVYGIDRRDDHIIALSTSPGVQQRIAEVTFGPRHVMRKVTLPKR